MSAVDRIGTDWTKFFAKTWESNSRNVRAVETDTVEQAWAWVLAESAGRSVHFDINSPVREGEQYRRHLANGRVWTPK